MNKQQLTEYYYKDLKIPVHLPDGRVIRNNYIVEAYKQASITINEDINRALTYSSTEKSNLYFWSDIHFGHNNIIKYSNRPFSSKEEMNQVMIENYKKTITDNDVVVWGGDIGFMTPPQINALVKPLPGKKILIIGNHDFHRKSTNLYEFDCFDEIHTCLPLSYDNIEFLITHYPLVNVPQNCYNIHGHIHTELINDGKHLNMCVEHTNYAPKSLENFVRDINAAKI